MADGYRDNAGRDASTLYDEDVVGDGYNATWLRRSDGSTLKYALAKYGTPGPVLGQRDSAGNDVGPKWAAKGSTNYTLPIDGNQYIGALNLANGQSGYARIGFRIVSGNTYQVFSQPNGGAISVLASGPLPAGASSIKLTWGAYSVPTGNTDAGGAVTNPASNAVAVSGNPSSYYTTATWSSTSGSRSRSYPLRIDFYSGASVVSTSNITLVGHVEGSV